MAKKKKAPIDPKQFEENNPHDYITEIPETCSHEIIEPIPVKYSVHSSKPGVIARIADSRFILPQESGKYWLETFGESEHLAKKLLEGRIADIIEILKETGTGSDKQTKTQYESLLEYVRRI